MDRFQYLLVLAVCVLLTLPLEIVFGARVWRRPRRLALSLLPGALLFLVWDVWAVAEGHWRFADRYVSGLEMGFGLPVEELLFFVVVPTCGLLTFEAIRRIERGDVPWLRIGRARTDAPERAAS